LEQFYRSYHLPNAEGGWYENAEVRVSADWAAKVALLRAITPAGAGRILDVGCGKGFFVRACVDAGYAAEGIDLSQVAVEYAKAHLGVRATWGGLSALKPELGTFDVVTLWATIEHLPNPGQTLRDIASTLRPGGHLLLDTGVADDWLDRLLPGVVQWYDPPQHLFVFSVDGMRRLLGACGFEIVGVDRCFDRTWSRRAARMLRAAVAATGLRIVSAASGMNSGPFQFTRFPLGNLMSVVARRRG
jgi:SAM-dependent methyltransferase